MKKYKLTCIPPAGSIPPANRQPRQRPVVSPRERSGTTLHIIPPDLRSQNQRLSYQRMLRALADRLSTLIETATETEEVELWQKQLARLRGFTDEENR